MNIWEYLIKGRLGFLMLSYYDDIPIAGVVLLSYKKDIVYKYGATDPAYMNLYANHALLWEVIKYGCKNGFQYMDWGRTDKGHEGLRKFKLGWGTEEKELTYTYINKSALDYSTGWKQKFIEKAVQKYPVWVGKTLGELLYKHMG